MKEQNIDFEYKVGGSTYNKESERAIIYNDPDIGIIGLEGKGPGPSGTPKQVGVLITGTSPYSIDTVGAKIMGFSNEDIPISVRQIC